MIPPILRQGFSNHIDDVLFNCQDEFGFKARIDQLNYMTTLDRREDLPEGYKDQVRVTIGVPGRTIMRLGYPAGHYEYSDPEKFHKDIIAFFEEELGIWRNEEILKEHERTLGESS